MTELHETEAAFPDILAALNRHDAEAVAEAFAEDGVVVNYSDPAVVHRGRAAIVELVRGTMQLLPDLKVELIDLVANENRLAAELLMRATPAGEAEPIEMQICAYYVFRDGKVVSEHVYMDSAQLSLAL